MSVILLTCPTDCTGALLDVSFNECAPEVHFGEIEKIFLWVDSITPPFVDEPAYNNILVWNAYLSNTGVDIHNIRTLTVIGEQPEPEQTETPISGDRIVVGYKKFTVPFEIDETNDDNYEFIFGSECNGKYKANYLTADGVLYGGYEGLDVSLKLNQVIPKSRQEIVKIMGKMTWSSKNHPPRTTLITWL
jgi:hypothetical protein